ncbi:MAG: Trk family potassium uptake protein [Lachnospiraceae bacterium]|nr:Trk family potassium uptake protein [Lachnospiraceae bacterium]
MVIKRLKNISYTRLIALSFFGVILVGMIFLCLPFSTRDGSWTAPIDALFTATSATCVTGLVAYDTFTHWNVFGQLVILGLIQIGGLGFMTIISLFAIFMKKRIGLHERKILMVSSGNMRISGMIQLIRLIAAITFLCEGIGAILLSFQFVPEMGWTRGIYNAIFHSISAFCNAGFDLMGRYPDGGGSLCRYGTNAYVLIVIAMLIIIGGIGFTIWTDVLEHKCKIRQYSLHSLVVLITTAVLITIGMLGYFVFEYKGNLALLTMPQKWLAAFFMSVTTRTAGFNAMNLNTLSPSGSLLTDILMLIGGSPGSTAGGMKTTTVAVMILSVWGMAKGSTDITVAKRRFNKDLIKHAAVIVFLYIVAVLVATMVICALEGVEISGVLFETSSALGTAGLTQGLSGTAGLATKIILIILMYGGRIGGLSLLLVFAEKKTEAPLKRPAERIMIG